MNMQNHLVNHIISTNLHHAPPKCMVENYIVTLLCQTVKTVSGLLKNLGLPCVPWCTMQVGGAQCSYAPLQWCKTYVPQTHLSSNSSQLYQAILRSGTEKHRWKTRSALNFDLSYIHGLSIRKHCFLW